MEYENIICETRDKIGIITFNRPKALNAIDAALLRETAARLKAFDEDPEIRVIILKGDDKTFAAGIDIRDMVSKINSPYLGLDDMQKDMKSIADTRKPVIAAVSGYALGIGCELALACDFILAADNARFGQPELSLGLIPSFGATQRLTHTIGKAKAMEMILTGRAMTAEEACMAGIVSRVIPLHDLTEESIKAAQRIAALPAEAVLYAKDAIKKAGMNIGLEDGIDYENKSSRLCVAAPGFRESLANFAGRRE